MFFPPFFFAAKKTSNQDVVGFFCTKKNEQTKLFNDVNRFLFREADGPSLLGELVLRFVANTDFLQ